jgi:hypothetical protein
MYYCSHLSHTVNIVRFSIFQYLPNDMHACPFIHVWKYCHKDCGSCFACFSTCLLYASAHCSFLFLANIRTISLLSSLHLVSLSSCCWHVLCIALMSVSPLVVLQALLCLLHFLVGCSSSSPLSSCLLLLTHMFPVAPIADSSSMRISVSFSVTAMSRFSSSTVKDFCNWSRRALNCSNLYTLSDCTITRKGSQICTLFQTAQSQGSFQIPFILRCNVSPSLTP